MSRNHPKITQCFINYLINKEEKTASVFDCLPNQTKIIIPYSINYKSNEYTVVSISACAFKNSEHIKSVKFAPNSEVHIIEKEAFLNSSIEKITIPSRLKRICENAFSSCINLLKVKIPADSELQVIEKFAFSKSSIKTISIPRLVTHIFEGAFYWCPNLEVIEIPSNSELKIIDKYAFYCASIKEISIPSRVTQICEGAFSFCRNLEKVDIPRDSDLRTIDQEAFSNSHVTSIFIPANLELKDGWCNCIEKLTNVEIDEKNQRYLFVDKKFIIGKSEESNENFDILVFATRDIVDAKIPSYIKIIGPYAFQQCQQLQHVEIPSDSELHIIGEYAFSASSIERILIPPNVEHICKSAFSGCVQLEEVVIQSNSELKTIGKNAFCQTSINNIFIPPNFVEFKNGWCYGMERLTKIKVDEKNQRYLFVDNKFIIKKSEESNENFDILVFATRDIVEAKIPSYIKIIGPYAFHQCQQLQYVEIPSNSELQIIGKYAFFGSAIEAISIPTHVIKICKYAFSMCRQLKKVEIPENSELKTIEKKVFCHTLIKSIFIPANLNDLKNGWCFDIAKLNKIKIDPRNPRYSCLDNKLIIGKSDESNEEYDIVLFAIRSIVKARIPDSIKIIGPHAFEFCKKLRRLEFSPNSKLQKIDKYAFNCSSIRSIDIPSSVTQIGKGSFYWCKQIQRISIPQNSNLRTIDEIAFHGSSIHCIYIPSNIAHIDNTAFSWCEIKITEIDENSQIQSKYQSSFRNSEIIMVSVQNFQ